MPPPDLRFRPDAIADLKDIYDSIAERSQSPSTARRFVDRILSRCETITFAPHGGRARDDLSPGLRMIPFERTAVIAYRVTDAVEITNVFYGGRDYEALYGNDDA